MATRNQISNGTSMFLKVTGIVVAVGGIVASIFFASGQTTAKVEGTSRKVEALTETVRSGFREHSIILDRYDARLDDYGEHLASLEARSLLKPGGMKNVR